jgi:hypothetical protein
MLVAWPAALKVTEVRGWKEGQAAIWPLLVTEVGAARAGWLQGLLIQGVSTLSALLMAYFWADVYSQDGLNTISLVLLKKER